MMKTLLILVASASALVPTRLPGTPQRHVALRAAFIDEYLKFDGSPKFDVVAKTQKFTSEQAYKSFRLADMDPDYYSKDYVFRGPIVGPFNRADLVETIPAFGLDAAFPDLERHAFGHCVDPENPYRCLYFERWTATHTGDLKLPKLPTAPATGRQSTSPAFPFSVVWNPDGRVIFEHLGPAVDRFEGNTKGKVAVFGLLDTAGLPLDVSVGNPILVFAQKVNAFLDFDGTSAKAYSKPEDVPSWWKSGAVGGEVNDV